MKLRLTLRLVRWTLRRLWQRRGALRSVATVCVLTLLASGWMRGPEIDRIVLEILERVDESVRSFLALCWVHPAKVGSVMSALRYLAFAAALVGLAACVRRVPCLLGSLVLTEFDRRHGRLLPSLEQLLNLSLPLALAVCLVCYGPASLLAWFHFTVAYGFVRLLNNPVRMSSILDWHARLRTSVDNPIYTDDQFYNGHE